MEKLEALTRVEVEGKLYQRGDEIKTDAAREEKLIRLGLAHKTLAKAVKPVAEEVKEEKTEKPTKEDKFKVTKDKE